MCSMCKCARKDGFLLDYDAFVRWTALPMGGERGVPWSRVACLIQDLALSLVTS
jgi:hypothetical protein